MLIHKCVSETEEERSVAVNIIMVVNLKRRAQSHMDYEHQMTNWPENSATNRDKSIF